MDYKGHKLISYGGMMLNITKIKEETDNIYNKKEELKNNIRNIIFKLNDLTDNIDNYFGIYINIINSYENKKKIIEYYKILMI